jgi:hypothetical protein
LEKKYVLVAKLIVNIKLNGAVATHYPDMIVVQCPDYESDGNIKGYIEYKRTAKQSKPLMKGLSQEF